MFTILITNCLIISRQAIWRLPLDPEHLFRKQPVNLCASQQSRLLPEHLSGHGNHQFIDQCPPPAHQDQRIRWSLFSQLQRGSCGLARANDVRRLGHRHILLVLWRGSAISCLAPSYANHGTELAQGCRLVQQCLCRHSNHSLLSLASVAWIANVWSSYYENPTGIINNQFLW